MPTNLRQHRRHLIVRNLLDKLTQLVPGSTHNPRISWTEDRRAPRPLTAPPATRSCPRRPSEDSRRALEQILRASLDGPVPAAPRRFASTGTLAVEHDLAERSEDILREDPTGGGTAA
jgi:hypothetical protein